MPRSKTCSRELDFLTEFMHKIPSFYVFFNLCTPSSGYEKRVQCITRQYPTILPYKHSLADLILKFDDLNNHHGNDTGHFVSTSKRDKWYILV